HRERSAPGTSKRVGDVRVPTVPDDVTLRRRFHRANATEHHLPPRNAAGCVENGENAVMHSDSEIRSS
ncbi:MAG: hypothetical protein ACKOYG_06560, partial [Ilumatobacteraceae bacterium]